MQVSIKFHRKDATYYQMSLALLLTIAMAAGSTLADHAMSEVWQDSDGLQMKYLTNHDDLLNTKGSELSLGSHDSPLVKQQQQASAESDQPETSSVQNEQQHPEADGVNSDPPPPAAEEKQSSPELSSVSDEDEGGDGDESSKAMNRASTQQQQASKAAPRYKSEPREQSVVNEGDSNEPNFDRSASYKNGVSSESQPLGEDKSKVSSDDSTDSFSNVKESPSRTQMRFESFGRAMHQPELASADAGSDDEQEPESKPLMQNNESVNGGGASNENIEEPKASGEPDFAAPRKSAEDSDEASGKQEVDSESETGGSSDADRKQPTTSAAFSAFRHRLQYDSGSKSSLSSSSIGGNQLQQQQLAPQQNSPDDERDNFISPGHFPGSMAHLTQAASETSRDQLALDSRGNEKFSQLPKEKPATTTTQQSEIKPTTHLVQVTPEPEVAPESQQIMAPILLATTTTQAPAAATVAAANNNSTNQAAAPTLRRLKLRKYR